MSAAFLLRRLLLCWLTLCVAGPGVVAIAPVGQTDLEVEIEAEELAVPVTSVRRSALSSTPKISEARTLVGRPSVSTAPRDGVGPTDARPSLRTLQVRLQV